VVWSSASVFCGIHVALSLHSLPRRCMCSFLPLLPHSRSAYFCVTPHLSLPPLSLSKCRQTKRLFAKACRTLCPGSFCRLFFFTLPRNPYVTLHCLRPPFFSFPPREKTFSFHNPFPAPTHFQTEPPAPPLPTSTSSLHSAPESAFLSLFALESRPSFSPPLRFILDPAICSRYMSVYFWQLHCRVTRFVSPADTLLSSSLVSSKCRD